jgi:hypothetical protein
MKPEVWLPVAICAASFLGTLSVVVVSFLCNNSRISDLRGDINERFHNMDHKFDNLDHRFDDLEKLFDTKLLRVEGVLDARMSRIEDMLSHR